MAHADAGQPLGGGRPGFTSADIDVATPPFRCWSGMAAVLPEIKAAVGADVNYGKGSGGKPPKLNGWAVMAVVLGTDEVCDRLISRLDTFSIIAGLMIVATIQLIASPSPDVTTFATVGGDGVSPETYRAAYITLTLLALICLFCTIIMSSLFTQTLRVATRDADRWRILLKRDKQPSMGDAMFTLGNIALAGAIGISLFPGFGVTNGIVFACVAVAVNGLFMHVFNFMLLLHLGHPVHGWYKHHTDEFDLTIPLQQLEALARIDASHKGALGARGA